MPWLGDDSAPLSGSVVEAAASAALTEHLFDMISLAVAAPAEFKISPALVCELHAIGANGIVSVPGAFRDGPASIVFAKHVPPPHDELTALVDDMCAHINGLVQRAHAATHEAGATRAGANPSSIDEQAAEAARSLAADLSVEAAAFALWRLNWIHPFEDGNGRTSRALCYLVFSLAAVIELPGKVTLPERIQRERTRYFRCLEAADKTWKNPRRRKNALQQLCGFLDRLWRNQLTDEI